MNKNIENILEDNSLNYAAYVLLDRALPDIRDGLKPVHRRIIYSMHLEKAYSFVKSANISGATMKLHPHGDAYGTMVNMVQKDKQFIPYLEGKGNFAQHTSRDLQAGASRYTEVKLSDFTADILKDVNNGIVDFIPNYDGTIMMPQVLPAFFPTVLTHSNSGIGVGMSSSIGSFNIKELCEAIKNYLETGEKNILIPDFPTGGYVIENEEVFSKINETGIGTIRLRSNYNINKNIIEITEIPYSTTREAIIDKIVELVKLGKIKEIIDIRDLTGINGQLIEIICKKNIDMELLMEKLYRLTPLESTFSFNMNMLIHDLPKVASVWTVIDEWLIWRRDCLKRKLSNEIEKYKKELHILKGFEKVLVDIDEAIKIIRFAEEDKILKTLMERFKIDEIQANEIANMKLRNINKDYIGKKLLKVKEIETIIADKENLLNNGIDTLICDDMLYSIKKYGNERKTLLIKPCEEIKEKIKEETKVIDDYAVKIITTKEGYVHKYKASYSGDYKLKENDEVVDEFMVSNIGELLVFSETDCYKILIDNLEETTKGSFGTFVPTLLNVKNIINIAVLHENYKYLLVWYDNNKIAKVNLKSFETKTNRKKLGNSLYGKAKVKNIWCLDEEKEFEVITKKKSYLKDTRSIALKDSRATQGVNIIGNKDVEDIIIR